MKNSMIKTALALLLAFSTQANADTCSGGDCSGGGNAPKSTDAEVSKALDELWEIERAVLYYANAEQILNPAYVQDPLLKRALQLGVKKRIVSGGGKQLTWQESGNFHDGQASLLQPKDHCYNSDGKEVEASTDYAPGSEICFNKTLLRNYSPGDLRLQMVALLIHERVHQMQKRPTNASERKERQDEAEAVQQHLLKYVGPILPYIDHIAKLERDARDNGVGIYSWSINLISLRPNGFQEIRSGKRSLTVACSRDAGNLINLEERMAGEADVFVAPGGVAVVPHKTHNGKKEFFAVTCLDAPRVRCSIGKIGDTYVFHAGASRGSASLEGARKRMKEMVDAGFCEDVTAKGSEDEQKDGPEGDVLSAE